MTARFSIRPLVRACVLAAAAGPLAACSGDFNPVRDAAVATGVGPDRRAAPAFVTQSRPADLDYVPTGRVPPPRAVAAKPVTTVRETEAAMEAARSGNEARGAAAREAGATPAPQAPRPVAQ